MIGQYLFRKSVLKPSGLGDLSGGSALTTCQFLENLDHDDGGGERSDQNLSD